MSLYGPLWACPIRMAQDEKLQHLGAITALIEPNHIVVESLGIASWHTDGIHEIGHQNAIHHEPRGSLVPIKKQLL